MVTISIDPYKALGVDRDATLTEIRTSYRKLVLKCHPDKVEDPDLKLEKQAEFQKVQGAYELLSDPTEREKYDEKVRRDKLRAFAAASVSPPNTTAPRTPPKYSAYHNANVRTAEPPRSFFTPNTTSSSSKMYAQTTPKSWEEIRVPDGLPKTARRAASYDERSSNGKQEEERRRRRDDEEEERRRRRVINEEEDRRHRRGIDEEEEEIEHERRHWEREQHLRAAEKEEQQRREDKQRRAGEKEQRKAAKEAKDKDAQRAEEKRLKKEKKKEKEEKKSKSRPYEETDEDGFSKSDKKKSSSRSLEKEVEKPENTDRPESTEKTEKKEHEFERDSATRERSLSAQRREFTEEKHNRALEHAMNYIKTSQNKATPGLGRANTYTSGVSYVAPPPIVPMPPVDEEEARRATRARRGSQESRTKEKPSSKKGPTLEALADEAPYIVVDSVPPPMSRHNLPRANTTTDREFSTRTSAEIPMPSPPRRAETFHYGNSERETEPRGRNRSRLQPQVSEEDESEEDYRRDVKAQGRRGSRARSSEMAAPRDYPYTTVYTVNDGRSRRETSFRNSPERNYAKPAYTYVQPPAMSSARVVEPRSTDPRSREGYSIPSSKIRVGKHYTNDDINYGPGYQEGWSGVRA